MKRRTIPDLSVIVVTPDRYETVRKTVRHLRTQNVKNCLAAPAGVTDHLPGHNGSYRRDVLLKYGDQLESMLDAESILHWDLRAKGHRLYLEPKARTLHQNFSVPFASILLRFHGGRLFASSRARCWPPWLRFVYTAGAPLIPLVRLMRIIHELRRPGRPRSLLPRVLPALVAGLVLDAAGEMAGYGLGRSNAMSRLSDMEFHRERYLRKKDKLSSAASKLHRLRVKSRGIGLGFTRDARKDCHYEAFSPEPRVIVSHP